MIDKNLKYIREQQNISRLKLEKKSNVSYRTIEFIEHGKVKNPGVYTVLKIAKALNVNINDLIK